MRAILSLLALIFTLSSCWSIPVDVSFATDPRILRGTWTGATESTCTQTQYIPVKSSMNSSGTRFFALSGKTLEVFDASNATKLGGFNLTSTALPVVWSPDGTKIIYLRTTANSSVERAEVNPTTGADLATATLATDFAGTDFNYNSDLTRVAAFVTSNFSGVSRVNLYDVVSGVLIKSKSLTTINAYTIALNAAGTQMAYSANEAGKSQLWTHDFDTDTTKKVFEQSSEISFGKPSFSGANQLVIQYAQQSTSQGTQLGIKRINLTDLSNKDTSVPYGFGARVSADATRFGYIENDVLFIKNLETNAIIAQKSLDSVSNQYSGSFGAVLSSNTTGTTWLVSGTRVGCAVRSFETNTQILTTDAKLASDDSQAVVMKFVPTYRDSSGYSFTGTIKFGTGAERNIRGSVSLPNGCSLFANCEKLVSSTTPVIPSPYALSQIHGVYLQYESGDTFEYPSAVVGYRYDQKKVRLFAGGYASGQNKTFLLDPPSTP